MSTSSEMNTKTPSDAEIINTQVIILHSLGREALDAWNAAGRPIPASQLDKVAVSEERAL